MNKFKQDSFDGHQMSLLGELGVPMSHVWGGAGGVPMSHVWGGTGGVPMSHVGWNWGCPHVSCFGRAGHVPCLEGARMGDLYSEVQCIMGNGHMGTSPPLDIFY